MNDLHTRLLAATGPLPRFRALHESDVNGPRAALRAVIELHAPEPYTTYSAGLPIEILVCWHCRSLCHSGSGLGCDDPTDGVWPCSTIQAIARELGVDG